MFSTHLTLFQLEKKFQDKLTTQISQKKGMFEGTPIKSILKDFGADNERFHSTAHIIPSI